MPILISLLKKTSSIRRICILFVLCHFILLLMVVFTFPIINDQIGPKAFDLQTFGYSLSEAKSIVNNLDQKTVAFYLFPQLSVLDFFYPFLLALFLSSFLFRLLMLTQGRIFVLVLILPFLAMGFDYLENIGIALMISKSIPISELIVYLSSTFTIMKGAFTSISWVMAMVLCIKWVSIKLTEKQNRKVV